MPEIRALTEPRELCTHQLLAEFTARTRQQAGIVALGHAALSGVEPTDLLDRAVHLLVEVLPVEYAKVLQLRPDRTLLLKAGVGWRPGLVGSAVVESQYSSQAGYTLLSDAAVVVDNLETETRFEPNILLMEHEIVSGMSVLIRGGTKPYGILAAHSTQRRRFSVDDVNCLQATAHVLAEAIQRNTAENVLEQARDRERTLRQQLEKYSEELRKAHETERHRIARELHDEVGQALTALKFMLERMELHSNGAMTAITDEAMALVTDLLCRVHDLSLDLRPSVLDDFGLIPSLVWLARRFEQQTGIRVELHYRGLTQRPSSEIEIGVYRVIQEALTNIARHAHVDRCVVRCAGSGATLLLSIRDRGVGFVIGQPGTGLVGMEERVRALGGQLKVCSVLSQGTLVCARLPLIKQAE